MTSSVALLAVRVRVWDNFTTCDSMNSECRIGRLEFTVPVGHGKQLEFKHVIRYCSHLRYLCVKIEPTKRSCSYSWQGFLYPRVPLDVRGKTTMRFSSGRYVEPWQSAASE